jgi:uncharacterized membrane protein
VIFAVVVEIVVTASVKFFAGFDLIGCIVVLGMNCVALGQLVIIIIVVVVLLVFVLFLLGETGAAIDRSALQAGSKENSHGQMKESSSAS